MRPIVSTMNAVDEDTRKALRARLAARICRLVRSITADGDNFIINLNTPDTENVFHLTNQVVIRWTMTTTGKDWRTWEFGRTDLFSLGAGGLERLVA